MRKSLAEQIETCDKKVTYLSQMTANNVAFLLSIIYNCKYEGYKCRYCLDFHVTSNSQKRLKADYKEYIEV